MSNNRGMGAEEGGEGLYMTKGHKFTANSAYVPMLPSPQLCFVLPLGGAPLSNVLGEAGDSPIIVLK